MHSAIHHSVSRIFGISKVMGSEFAALWINMEEWKRQISTYNENTACKYSYKCLVMTRKALGVSPEIP